MRMKRTLILGVIAGASLVMMGKIAWRDARGQDTYADHVGHYDIDGVSYDHEEAMVVVASDGRTPDPVPIFI